MLPYYGNEINSTKTTVFFSMILTILVKHLDTLTSLLRTTIVIWSEKLNL